MFKHLTLCRRRVWYKPPWLTCFMAKNLGNYTQFLSRLKTLFQEIAYLWLAMWICVQGTLVTTCAVSRHLRNCRFSHHHVDEWWYYPATNSSSKRIQCCQWQRRGERSGCWLRKTRYAFKHLWTSASEGCFVSRPIIPRTRRITNEELHGFLLLWPRCVYALCLTLTRRPCISILRNYDIFIIITIKAEVTEQGEFTNVGKRREPCYFLDCSETVIN